MEDGEVRIPARHAAELADSFAAHDLWLFGHACARTRGDRELAADLVQDTSEAAARSWDTLREHAARRQRAWLLSTLAHKDVSDFRHRKAAALGMAVRSPGWGQRRGALSRYFGMRAFRRAPLAGKFFARCKKIASEANISYIRQKTFTLHGIYLLSAAAQKGLQSLSATRLPRAIAGRPATRRPGSHRRRRASAERTPHHALGPAHSRVFGLVTAVPRLMPLWRSLCRRRPCCLPGPRPAAG